MFNESSWAHVHFNINFQYVFNDINIATRMGVRMAKLMGSSSDDWIYWHFCYNLFQLQLL
jgi:hypothetical protein